MNNTTRSELSFSPTVEDDGKYMVCRAENPVVSGLFLESSWKISVVCEYFFSRAHAVMQLTQKLFKYKFSESVRSSRVHDAFTFEFEEERTGALNALPLNRHDDA